MSNESPEQLSLFEQEEWWHEQWKDMPEYVQEDLEPEYSVAVHFATLEDLRAFSEFIGQPIHRTTRSIWFPKAEIGRYADKVYLSEEEPKS